MKAANIAIVDPCCTRGYDPDALNAGGLGGTEATVLRVSVALTERTEIVHFQKGRTVSAVTTAGRMRPLEDAFAAQSTSTFIVINAWKVACKLRKVHPHARIILWLHIHPGRHNRPMAQALTAARVAVICVSRSHATAFRAFLRNRPLPFIDFIHNPIADDLTHDATVHDPDRLLFASSPHKGLAQVFTQFRATRDSIPNLTLAVADPGYLAWDTGPVPDGVTFLGPLPHAALIAQMRQSLCLFYPQTTFAETFGLVMAEANAVGLPVLAHHDIGANAEVLGDTEQVVDGADPDQIVARIRTWRILRPTVTAQPHFRLAAVTKRWSEQLNLSHSAGTQTEKVA